MRRASSVPRRRPVAAAPRGSPNELGAVTSSGKSVSSSPDKKKTDKNASIGHSHSLGSLLRLRHLRGAGNSKSRQRRSSLGSCDTEASTASRDGANVLQFLTWTCPPDLVPKILAYAGPQTTASLSKVNRHWNQVVSNEETWRILSEELYKWKPGQPLPQSWKEYYLLNPCVPVDFATVQSALVALSEPAVHQYGKLFKRNHLELNRNVRVLLRPGIHHVRRTIPITGLRRSVQVTIETMAVPETYRAPMDELDYLLDDDDDDDDDHEKVARRGKAILRFSVNRRNEPLIRVFRGELTVKNVCLDHHCYGVDIWNGNAAVHIRPMPDDTLGPPQPSIPRASATFEKCQIASRSGRGVVVVEGCNLALRDSYVHDCAATGIYIGGRTTSATIQRCDVVDNGKGSRFGGVFRGHSGIYIEQGEVNIDNCNVSHNSACGISVVSQDQGVVTMKGSDVMSNGFGPLELPADHQLSRIDMNEGNRITLVGRPLPRTPFLMEQRHRRSSWEHMEL